MTNYVLVKLQGGFANQLFQYALGYCISKKNNHRLVLDVTSSRFDMLREYELGKLIINHKTLLTKMQRKMFIFLNLFRGLRFPIFYTEKTIKPFNSNLLEAEGDIVLSGYFQSEKYFLNFKDDISNLIFDSLQNIYSDDDPIIKDIVMSESVAIHIRRGDYVENEHTNTVHGTCNLDYYRRSIEYLMLQVKDPHFLIFTDDPLWVNENFRIDYPYHIVSSDKNGDFLREFNYMMKCKYFIIANSSFSWWAAWLGKSPNKIVISPKVWFKDTELESQVQDLIPEKWIRI